MSLSIARAAAAPHRAAEACDQKQHFRSEHAGRVWAQDWIRSGRATDPVLYVYHCRFCGDWHLTKHHDDPTVAGVTARDLWA